MTGCTSAGTKQIDPQKLENVIQGIAHDIILLSEMHNNTVDHLQALEKRTGVKVDAALTKIATPTPTAAPKAPAVTK